MKDDMLILTWSFFNKYGNQSLYEAVVEYCKVFNVTIVTSAGLSDNLYAIEEIQERIPEVRIIKAKNTAVDIIKNVTLDRVKAIRMFSKAKEHITIKNRDYIKNIQTTTIEYLAYIVNNRIIYSTARDLIVKESYNPKFICAYETGGIIPALLLKERVIPTAVTFGKFQGTVLGSVLDRLNDPEIVKMFKIEIHGMQHAKMLDACIMTNDGTKGKDVLQHFHVADENILFITNGIPNHLAIVKQKLKSSQKRIDIPINLFTLSRFTYWKRVNLAIEVMNNLINNLQDFRYRLNIYGIGSDQETKDLEVLIKQYNLMKYVKIHGKVPFNEIYQVFHENDILLSLYLFSNLCNPVLEAVYLTKPVITIQQDDLIEAFKGLNNKLILMDVSEENGLISAVAQYLHNMPTQDVISLVNNRMDDSLNLLTWHDRIKQEIKFVQAHFPCNLARGGTE